MKQSLTLSLKLLTFATSGLISVIAFAQVAVTPPSAIGTTGEALAIGQTLGDINRFGSDIPASTHSFKTVDLTAREADIWGRMRRGFSIPDLTGPAVDKQLALLTARPQAVSTILEHGRKYLYYIVAELEKRGMPSELALLPLVESAYNPMAFSSAKAAGLWQFIPSTGKDFSLQQNWWVDERRDVLASTAAALQYLQAVYELQGDWHLALASYNWGENSVMRAVNSNRNAGKPTDFNSLTMPRETQQYVPKFQAIKMIVAHPERYGITLPDIPNAPYFVKVQRTQGMDVAIAAKLAEMPLVEFRALNPAYNRPVIPGDHVADLLLPVDKARNFEENLASYSANQPLVSWKTYTLPSSARIEDVASRLKVVPAVLRSVNGLPARAKLATGYTLLVPQDSDTDAADEALPTSVNGHKPPHVIRQGSTPKHATVKDRKRS